MMYYLGTVVLRMSPSEFWKCPPRRFNALCKMHARANSVGTKNEKQYAMAKHGKYQGKPVKHHRPSGQPIGQPDGYADQLGIF